VTVKNAELRLVTTADQFAGIADGSSSGWAPVTVALIRVLASVTVTGEGEATAAGERGTTGWLVAALGETAEVGVPDVAHAANKNTRTDAVGTPTRRTRAGVPASAARPGSGDTPTLGSRRPT
jgi:hypothetical protein